MKSPHAAGSSKPTGSGSPTAQSLVDVRRETGDAIEAAMQSDRPTLIDAPPASGKTTSTFERAAELGLPITYLTERRDLYDQGEGLAFEYGIQPYVLPSPHSDCPTFKGDHGEEIAAEVKSLYNRGVSAWRIHDQRDLPCGDDCPYLDRLDFEPEHWDVLIGHYRHAYAEKYVDHRVIVIDEFAADAFIQYFQKPQPIITAFLRRHSTSPFDGYSELIRDRGMWGNLQWFGEHQVLLDYDTQVLDDDSGDLRSDAGVLALAPLLMRDLGNGWHTTQWEPEYVEYVLSREEIVGVPTEQRPERHVLPERCVVARHYDEDHGIDEFWFLNRPDLSSALTVVGLDGTPVRTMWNTVFGLHFDVESIVSEQNKAVYLGETLNIAVHRAGEGTKPYSSGRYSYPESDEALLLGIGVRHGEKPGVISSKRVLNEYRREGVLDRADGELNYARVLSSNAFEDKQIGAVLGSPHPGGDTIKRWGALMGEPVTSNSQKGVDLSYGPVGDDILRHFREHQVLQSILRFGRNDDESDVYVNHEALPDWINAEPEKIGYFVGSRKRCIVDFLRESDSPVTRGEIVEETGVSESSVYRVIDQLDDAGFVRKTPGAGRQPARYQWGS